MQVDLSTVPGEGVLHHCRTRDGSQFCVITRPDGARQLVIYHPDGHDTPLQTVTLESDEADQVAEFLHSTPIQDRLAALERRLDRLSGERGPA
jgi:K+/H+ antiporter YhaU regulatory subunit KhtT